MPRARLPTLQTGQTQLISIMRTRTYGRVWLMQCVSGWRRESTDSVAIWLARFLSSSGRKQSLVFVLTILKCTCLQKVRSLNFIHFLASTLHMRGNFTICLTQLHEAKKIFLSSSSTSQRMQKDSLQMHSALCLHRIMMRTHGPVPSSREWGRLLS